MRSINCRLNYDDYSDMITVSHIQIENKMTEKERLLSEHPYAIWEGIDGYWHTYVVDEGKGRIPRKRKTKEALEAYLVEYYKKQRERRSPRLFKDVYFLWRKTHDLMLADNSIQRYDTDYRRFFYGTDFENIPIEELNEEHITAFLIKTSKEQRLCKEACKTLFGYIKNTVYSARVNRFISNDPVEFLKAKQFYKFCTEKERPIEKTVISDETFKILFEQIERDKRENPTYLPIYAVHLAILTGMRVGEISGLRWDSITQDYIIIDKSEKYNRKTKQYYIDSTKNKKERVFPISNEIKELLTSIKRVSIQAGIMSEWVFANEEGRIHAPVISSCLKNKCLQLGIPPVGIHACRRTFNSKMKCLGVSSIVAASLLGHSEQVNEQYYTFDVTSIKEKADIVNKVNLQIGRFG